MPDLIEDVDELAEGEYYHYVGDSKGRHFRVDLSAKDDDDFAGYGEGSIQFLYSDGYVADLPVSNVERYIDEDRLAHGKP